MKRGIWIGAVALSLGGTLPNLGAQQAVWHPLQQPPATVRGVASDLPGASLGRPLPVSRGVAPEDESVPRLFPQSYRGATLLAPARVDSGVEPIATVAPPGAVIATSASSLVGTALPVVAPAAPAIAPAVSVPGTVTEQETADLFATDRAAVGGTLPLSPMSADAHGPVVMPVVMPVGNWQEKYSATTPPTPIDAPMFDEPDAMRAPRLYFGAEYLLWWVRPDHAPPLATTGDPQNGALAGRLGRADTVILDNGTLYDRTRSGVRFTAGYSFEESCDTAIEVGGLFLPQTSGKFNASSAQFPILARPFFSLNEGIERVQFIGLPGTASGSLNINSPSELWGLELNGRCQLCCGCDYRIDALAGFRFMSLREQLEIVENVQNAPGGPDPFNGTLVVVRDSFATNNQFYGPQVGIAAQKQFGQFTIDGVFKLAMGVTHEELIIQGSQTFPPGTPNVDPRPGGLYALNSNIGNFSRNRFAVMPEVGAALGYYLTENVQLTLGYNFLYWSSVVRPGDQIDRNIDLTRVPNPDPALKMLGLTPLASPHPAVLFKDSDFWAQGITFGVRFTF
jgi:hypothetical protein